MASMAVVANRSESERVCGSKRQLLNQEEGASPVTRLDCFDDMDRRKLTAFDSIHGCPRVGVCGWWFL